MCDTRRVSAGGDDDTDEDSALIKGAVEALQMLSCNSSSSDLMDQLG